MDRDEAMRLLAEGNPRERLEAARYLSKGASPGDVDRLAHAFRDEDSAWTKAALQEALDFAKARASPSNDLVASEDEATDVGEGDAFAQAIQEISDRMVHELEPLLGAIRYYASVDVPNFQMSKTRRELDRMQEMLSAIERLGQAAASPSIEKFDLAQRIADSVQLTKNDPKIRIELVGRKPHLVTGDPALIELIVRNALQNAIEATEAVAARNRGMIVVNWDDTDKDYWVVVLDEGEGLPPNAEGAFDVGSTNKPGHLGMGLALALRASQTLRGVVNLGPNGTKGARFEFRWPRPRQKE